MAVLFRLGLVMSTVFLLASCSSTGASTESNVTVGFITEEERSAAVVISGVDLEGNPIDLEKPASATVLNVWASWCAPCRGEAAELVEVADQTADSGVRFIGINVRDSLSAALAFQRRFEVNYPSVFDPSSRTLLQLGGTLPPSAIPSTVVLDSQNRVAARIVGAVTAPTLRAVIEDVSRGGS